MTREKKYLVVVRNEEIIAVMEGKTTIIRAMVWFLFPLFTSSVVSLV
jgi:hypothetical protein